MRSIIILSFMIVIISGCKLFKKGEVDFHEVTMAEINFSASPNTYHGQEEILFKLHHTKLEVSVDVPTRSLTGKAYLYLSPYAYPQDSIVIDAKRLKINSIRELGNRDDSQLPYYYDGKQITISLRKIYNPKDTLKLYFDYEAHPYQKDSLYEQLRKSEFGLFFNNYNGLDSLKPQQFYTQGETEFNSAWFPTLDANNQRMTQEIALTVDKSFTTFSNGTLYKSTQLKNGKRTDFWKLNKPHAPYLAVIAGGKLNITEETKKLFDSIPVKYYLEDKYHPHVKEIFGKTPDMLQYFSKLFGVNYPWQSFSQLVVRDFVTGAMENTTAVIHGELVQQLPNDVEIDRSEDYISHELGHQWFGDLITCESWAQLAMNESFATYCEYLWKEHQTGFESAEIHRLKDLQNYIQESKFKKEPIIQYIYKKPESLFDRHRYQKGGLVLHLLRKEINNDSLFFLGIKKYLTSRSYKTTNIFYFQKAMEEVTGRDFQLFFDQWFLKPGHLDIDVTQKYDSIHKKVTLFVTQLNAPNEPIFRVKVPISIYYKNSPTVKKTINLDKISDSFTFNVIERPINIDINEEGNIPSQVSFQKDRKDWLYQMVNAKTVHSRYNAVLMVKKYRELYNKDSLLTALRSVFKENNDFAVQNICDEIIYFKSFLYYDEVADKIRSIALTHPVATVRRSALKCIKNHEAEKGKEVYLTLLKDSCVPIQQSALDAVIYQLTDKDNGLKILTANQFEKIQNSQMQISIADFYSTQSDISKLPLLRGYVRILPIYYQGGVLSSYRKLLIKADSATFNYEFNILMSLPTYLQEGDGIIAYKSTLENLSRDIADDRLKYIKFRKNSKDFYINLIKAKISEVN